MQFKIHMKNTSSQYSIMQKIHLQSMIEDAEQQKIKYIKTIQENKNKILHEKDVERRTNQERVEEEQKETNIQILKLMRNIIGIQFREDAGALLNLIKSTEEFKTAHLVRERNKYLNNQLDQCFKAHSNYIAKLPKDGVNSEIEWIASIKRVFDKVNNKSEKYIQSSRR